MSYHGDMHKKDQADLAVARKDMEARNAKHMAELAKQQPTPTIEEVQAALAGKNKDAVMAKKKDDVKEEEVEIKDVAKDVKDAPKDVRQEDRAMSASQGGNYKTRDAKPNH